MKLTDVDKYVALREALVNEKTALESRLAAINRALQGSSGIAAPKGGLKPGPNPIVRRGVGWVVDSVNFIPRANLDI